MGLFGNNRETAIWDKLWETIGKSGNQRRGELLYREKHGVGSSCFEQKSIGGVRKFRMVPVSHWLGCGIVG